MTTDKETAVGWCWTS